MPRKLARLREFGVTGLSPLVLTWSQRVAEQTEANFADQQTQLDTINAILDDNTLTPDKKPNWIFFDAFLTGEQSALDSQATAYGITTEKTNYDNALSALATYLATLTTPVAWNDVTGNTTISGTTLRSKFNDVMVKKQALLNKMHAAAKTLADSAQTTANTATTNAATAQTAADTVKRDDKITSSSIIPANVLSATDAGSDASIVVAAHTRLYGDGSQLSVGGHTFTALAYSTDYGVYYDDTTTLDTTPTYHTTTTLSHALNSFVAGRHFVGEITTPAALGAATTGGTTPIGTDSADRNKYSSL